jgi:hypothetical protein
VETLSSNIIMDLKMQKPSKTAKVEALVQKAARKVDAKSITSKEVGGHLLTAANAVKSGKAIPVKSAKAIRK